MKYFTAVKRSKLILASLLCCGCLVSCSTGDDCDHSCPRGTFVVTVPQDRYATSVKVTGPCSFDPADMSETQVYLVYVDGEGVCHVTVSFRPGEPDFEKDVLLAKATGGCCSGVAYAQGNVTVPEDTSAN